MKKNDTKNVSIDSIPEHNFGSFHYSDTNSPKDGDYMTKQGGFLLNGVDDILENLNNNTAIGSDYYSLAGRR